jgi:bacillithiol biosynthesis cysteine-adding enzyme BshC
MTDVRILTETLGGSPLSLLMQRGEAPPEWCGVRPRTAEEWRARAMQRAASTDWARYWSKLEPAFSANGLAKERLDRVRRNNGIVVTTGQQPGLFGGPVYTWSKALGALALADALEAQLGIPCAAVFWAATDDADFAEASFTMVARPGGVDVLRSEFAPPDGTPMSLAPLGDLTAHRARLRHASGSIADPRPLDVIDRTYGDAAASVGGAYVQLLREMLEPLGVPVLDASHDGFRQASDNILRRALECAPLVERALQDRRTEIERAGLTPQVDDVKGLSLVFARENGIKRRIAVSEASAMAAASDSILTPNVVLRPVVEASILPTVAYLGGPGEIAYFAQVGAVAQALGVDQPLVVPRWSCTLIEPHVAVLLEKFGVQPDALARPDALESSVARAALHDDTAHALKQLREAIQSAADKIAPEAEGAGVGAALRGGERGLQHRVDRLERRIVAAVKRREHVQLQDVASLRAALYPHGKRQERALNLIPMLARHGVTLLEEMRIIAATHASALIGSH